MMRFEGEGGAGDAGSGRRRRWMRSRGGCWRWEKRLTSGPELLVTGKKEKGERGRCWAAAANGPEEGAGPCGEHGLHAGWKREGEKESWEGFLFFQRFSF
jgi:hypothetical protein